MFLGQLLIQCQFGLADPMNHKLYRKRAALDVNSELFAAALMKGASCTHAQSLAGGRHMETAVWQA